MPQDQWLQGAIAHLVQHQKSSIFASCIVALQYEQWIHWYYFTLATMAKVTSLLGVKALGNSSLGIVCKLGN